MAVSVTRTVTRQKIKFVDPCLIQYFSPLSFAWAIAWPIAWAISQINCCFEAVKLSPINFDQKHFTGAGCFDLALWFILLRR